MIGKLSMIQAQSIKIKHGPNKGFSLLEMLMVVAVIGVLAMCAVPIAEISYIGMQETLLENNLDTIRQAIELYRKDAIKAAREETRFDPDQFYNTSPSEFYPEKLEDLASPPESVEIKDKDGVFLCSFRPKPYLSAVPADPFVGRACWKIHFASSSSELEVGTFSSGVTEAPTENCKGVFSVSCVGGNLRRGFETAIDGTKYEDW